ncbi:hypothetical protein TIFTF001_043967 [Ficus carica]|uniref:RST domain-containing protein n=1 Tax=Ficus carica TaxID=3494 RepID=A0AA87ZER6_FICCA|nr:hypothetical protein TIFTF001_043967 [Ficus carica]
MQLQELFGKLKKEEISKESFVRLIRSVVGEQVLRLAVLTVQQQAPSVNSGPSQFSDPRSFAQVHQKGTSSSADVSHVPSSAGQVQTKPSQSDSHGMQASHKCLLLPINRDESMHSGVDEEAFQAALNRDIGGDVPPASQPYDSDSSN